MAIVRLDKAAGELTARAQKGYTPTALLSAQQAIGDTNRNQVGSDSFDIGNHPKVAGMLRWTKGSGTVGKIRAFVSKDGSAGSWQWAPSYGAPSSGVSAASIAEITYAIATWYETQDGTASTTVLLLPFEFNLESWRHVKLFFQSDSGTGSLEVESFILLGTGE